jgi:hypothetical protein
MALVYRLPALYAGDTEILTIPMTHGDGGSNILLSEVDTAVFTLKNVDDDAVINSRDEQDVLNANDFTIADGSIEYAIQPEDTALVDTTATQETHRGEFILTLLDGQIRSFIVHIPCKARPYTV